MCSLTVVSVLLLENMTCHLVVRPRLGPLLWTPFPNKFLSLFLSRSLPGRRFAGLVNRTRRRGRVGVYVTPWCFAHPDCQPFWLGGVSDGGLLSEGRRAQGQ